MAKTRDLILNVLQARGLTSVDQLAALVGVSAVSIRHHLSALQAGGLVHATEQRQRVGRPRLLYSLTEAALEQRLPRRYARLSGRLLEEMKAALPSELIEQIFTGMARKRAIEHTQRFAGLSLEQKMDELVTMLGEEGFMAEWNWAGEEYHLTEHNCPYFTLGQIHPEICTFDQVLISEVLDTSVEKSTCLLNGDQQCVFVIQNPALAETVE